MLIFVLSHVPKKRRKTMGTIDISTSKTHVLAFPLPAKGHINPLLHLCNRLVSKGFKVTLITTDSTFKNVTTAAAATSLINIESIPDFTTENESSTMDAEEYFKRLKLSATQAIIELIQKYKRSNFPPKVIVYDSTVPWVLELAHEQGLQGAPFFTQSCSVCAIYYHMLQGTIENKPLKELTEVSVPLLPPLESNDLPDFDYFIDGKQSVRKLLLDQFSNIDKVDYILFNSFDKLEEVAKWMGNKWPILTIGPTAPSMSEKLEDGDYLFETNKETCLKWLDNRENNSVIYVSFGSIASIGEEQMNELAEALIKINCYFLWIVRSEEESKLPKHFQSSSADHDDDQKGLIINWCPQLDVLAHRSLACFITHCGWNSTLEALSSGVPMIGVPQWVDQTTNAKCIEDVWKSGIRVKIMNEKGIVRREEFERCIRVVIETEKGKELKRNAMKWKELAKEAMSEGGSSDRNIEQFASALCMLSKTNLP